MVRNNGKELNITNKDYTTVIKKKKKATAGTVRFLTVITSFSLAMASLLLLTTWMVENSFVARLLTHIFEFNESVGVWFGGLAIVLLTFVLITFISFIFFVIGIYSDKIWEMLVTRENEEVYRTIATFLFGVFCCLMFLLIL